MSIELLIIPIFSNSDIKRFWDKVKISDEKNCWPWQASLDTNKYGNFRINRHIYKPHRLAWHLTNGSIPDKLYVLHHCDNPCCCNPSHLFLGTAKDNARDRDEKHRGYIPIGENNHNAKFTNEDIVEIRRIYATGKSSHRKLARLYSVDHSTIGWIVSGKSWKHVL